MVHWNFSLT